MGGRCLIDTNIVIALFANELAVVDRLSHIKEVFLPSVVIGELYYGAYKSGYGSRNIMRIDQFISVNSVLSSDVETAKAYGKIKDELRMKGKPIPENDIWIAALARQHRFTLVSRDAHFNEISGLKVESW